MTRKQRTLTPLAAGVTTVRDMANDREVVAASAGTWTAGAGSARG